MLNTYRSIALTIQRIWLDNRFVLIWQQNSKLIIYKLMLKLYWECWRWITYCIKAINFIFLLPRYCWSKFRCWIWNLNFVIKCRAPKELKAFLQFLEHIGIEWYLHEIRCVEKVKFWLFSVTKSFEFWKIVHLQKSQIKYIKVTVTDFRRLKWIP